MSEKMELSEKQAEEGLVDEAQALLAEVRPRISSNKSYDAFATERVAPYVAAVGWPTGPRAIYLQRALIAINTDCAYVRCRSAPSASSCSLSGCLVTFFIIIYLGIAPGPSSFG